MAAPSSPRFSSTIVRFLLFPTLMLVALSVPQCKKSIVEPPAAPDLTPPTNLTIAVFPGTQKVQVSWTLRTTEAVGVSVERRIGFFAAFQQIALSTSPVTSVIDSLSNPDSAYFYRVRHYKNLQYGPYSDTAAINLGLPAPTALDTTSITEEAINLRWTDNASSESGFTVERRDASAGPGYVVIARLDSNTTVYSDTAQLDGGATYYYRVKALGASDLGVVVASLPSNVLTVAVPQFPAPTNLTVTAPAETLLTLHWVDNTASENRFIIEIKSDTVFASFDSVGANVTTYSRTGVLKTDSAYIFRIRAVSPHRRSPYSAVGTGTLAFPPPSGFVAANVPERGISFIWTDNSTFESGFVLERREGSSGSFVPVSAVIPADATSFIDSVSSKTDSTLYTYRLRAISPKQNQSAPSNAGTAFFTFPHPTALTMTSSSLASVDLNWQLQSTLELGVVIERNNVTLAKTDSLILPAGTTHTSLTGFDNRCAYQFRVKAVRGSQESKYTSPLLAGASALSFSQTRSISDSTDLLAVSADSTGLLVASGGTSGIVHLWNATTGGAIAAFVPDTLSAVLSLGISPTGKMLVSGYADGTVRAWDLTSDTLVWKKTTSSAVFTLAWNPAGTTFATGHADQAIRVWSPGTGTVTRTLSGHLSSVTSLAYSAGGTSIVSGSLDQSIKIWNAGTGTELTTIASAHTGKINSVAFLQNDDAAAVSAGADGLVRLWNTTTGSCIKTNLGHLGGANAVVSPDSRSVFSAGADNSVRLWKASSWNLAQTLTSHTDIVTCAALSADRSVLVTGGHDQKIIIWSIASAWAAI